MKRSWCRLYAEFAFDPKVQSMSEALQRRFIMLMCLKCNGDETLHETELAFALRLNEDELAATKAQFLSKGFIDEQWNLLNWDERQYVSDSSTSRVKKHRETKLKQECNVSVTPPDTDTERKIYKKKIVPPESVTVEMVTDWAKENIPPHIDMAHELKKFRVHPKTKSKKDGVRSFQQWLIRAIEYNPKPITRDVDKPHNRMASPAGG